MRLFIVPLKIQISSKQFWPLNDWFHCHKCFRGSKVKQFVLALPVQYLWEEDVKWISIPISPACVCFRVSLNSRDVQGEKTRSVLQFSLLTCVASTASITPNYNSVKNSQTVDKVLFLERKICAPTYTIYCGSLFLPMNKK